MCCLPKPLALATSKFSYSDNEGQEANKAGRRPLIQVHFIVHELPVQYLPGR